MIIIRWCWRVSRLPQFCLERFYPSRHSRPRYPCSELIFDVSPA